MAARGAEYSRASSPNELQHINQGMAGASLFMMEEGAEVRNHATKLHPLMLPAAYSLSAICPALPSTNPKPPFHLPGW